MFSKAILSVAAIVACATSALAAPTTKRSSFSPISFNSWGGFDSLNNFDNFFGVDNFSGLNNNIILIQDQNSVCQDQSINIVQQQLAVVSEFAKRILTESICEVESQALLYSQFLGGLNGFSSDLLRQSGRDVGFDSEIAALIAELLDQNNNLVFNDLGFDGNSIGSNFLVPTGNNWVNSVSPVSVGSAFGLGFAAGGL